MVLTAILQNNAQKLPHGIALTMRMGFRTVNMTYRDVYDISRKIALLLEKEGLGKGDKVLLLAPNSPYWITVFWGCLLAGVIVVPLNIQSTPEMVEKIAKQTGAKLFFAHRFYRHGSPLGVKRYDVDLIKDELENFKPEDQKSPVVHEDDLVEILYTSGTTGDPKGVMLSHKNLFSNIKAASQMAEFIHCQERILSILPLSHIFEQAVGFLLPYFYGAQIIYAHSPAAIKELLNEYNITKMIAVPEFLKIMMGKIELAAEEKGKTKIFEKLLKFSEKVSKQWFSRLLFRSVLKNIGGKLDTIVCGGAPLDEALEKKWNALGIVVFQGYGLTETAPLVSSNTYEERRFGSVGKIAPEVEVRITSEGEIQVKGPNVFSGYFQDEARTKEVFTPDGFFKTGDMGEMDKDGFLFIKGRKKYMILGPGGQNVFPEDVEEVLSFAHDVKDSCVIGLTKPNGLVEIHAVLLLGDHKNGAWCQAWCDLKDGSEDVAGKIIEQANKKLASYQQITGYSVWPDDDFPRSATKKVKKNVVIDFVAKQTEEKKEVDVAYKGPVISLLAQITSVPKTDITGETKLGDLQVDSLMRIELIARVEDSFGVVLDETEITLQTTVLQIETMIKEKKPIKGLPPLRRWPRAAITRFVRVLGQSFLFFLMKIFVKLRVEGLENIKNFSEPLIFMPNHPSYLDPLVVTAALPKKYRKWISFAAANDVLYKDYKQSFYLMPFRSHEKKKKMSAWGLITWGG